MCNAINNFGESYLLAKKLEEKACQAALHDKQIASCKNLTDYLNLVRFLLYNVNLATVLQDVVFCKNLAMLSKKIRDNKKLRRFAVFLKDLKTSGRKTLCLARSR